MLDTSSIDNITIDVFLMGREYTQASIRKFTMKIPMNQVPYGSFQIMCNNDPGFIIHSGEYGLMKMNHTGSKYMNDTTLTFIVDNMPPVISIPGTNNYYMNVLYHLGSFDMYNTRTVQKYGTAPAVMTQIMKTSGIPEPINTIPSNSSNDKMNWVCIKSTMEGSLGEIGEHSFMEGDYLYYTFSTDKCNFIISSIGTSKTYYPHQMFTYYKDAYQTGSNSSYFDGTSNYKAWFFNRESRYNDAGENKQDLFPNIVYSSFEGNKPDVGRCDNECFGKLLKGAGYTNQSDIENCFGPSGYSFGNSYLIRDYPLNTHNMYQIAPVIRRRYIATLGKKMTISLANTVGPDVGSSVYVYSKQKDRIDDAGLPDEIYSDEYVIMEKVLIKDGKDEYGRDSGNEDLHSIFTIGSANLLTGRTKDVSAELKKIKFPDGMRINASV